MFAVTRSLQREKPSIKAWDLVREPDPGSERRAALLAGAKQTRRILLLVLVAGIPLTVVPGVFLDPFDLPKLGLLLVGTTVAGTLRAIEYWLGGPSMRFRSLILPATALAVPLLLSWLASPYAEWGVLGHYQRYQGLVPYLMVIALGLFLADDFVDSADLLVWALVGSGALVGLYALAQMVGLDPLSSALGRDVTEFVPSTLGHSNFVGGFLAAALPAALALWVRGGPSGRLAAASCALIAMGLIGSFSQGGWLAALAGVAATVGALLKPKSVQAWRIGIAVAILVAVVAVGSVLISMATPHGPFAGTSIMTRALHWRSAASMASDSIIVGKGPDAFAIEGITYRPPLEALMLGFVAADDPHSVPWAFLANEGAIGLLGFLVVPVWVGSRAAQLEEGAVPAAFLGVVVAYFVQSLVSIDELALRVTLWCGLAGFACCSGGLGPARVSLPRALPRKVVTGLLMCSVMLMTSLGALKMAVADSHALHMTRSLSRDRIGEARRAFRSAVSARDVAEYRILFGQGITRAALHQAGGSAKTIEDLREAFGSPQALSQPRLISSYAYNLKRLSGSNPRIARDSLELFRQAQSLDPHNPLIAIGAADLSLLMERPAAAYAALRPFLPVLDSPHPDYVRPYPEFWGAIAITRIALGDGHGARKALDKVSAVHRNECHVLIAKELLARAGKSGRIGKRSLAVRLACERSTARLLEVVKPTFFET